MNNKNIYQPLKPKNLKRLIRVAKGEELADIVLKNGEVFHVFTGEFLKCDVAIVDGYIAGIGENYHGLRELDMSGRYITPGFIDAHVHIESSMLAPAEFARAALPTGTTTIIADPHEIANVKGLAGIQYILDSSENIPLNVYVMLPSCVPSTHLENAGANLLAEDLEPFLSHPRVLGLAEMMNAPGVLNGDSIVHDKLEMAKNYVIDGHAPVLSGKNVMGYAAAGISSDHECATAQQAFERLRAGIHVLIREGSAAKNLKALVRIINPDTAQFCSFAADDKIPADMLNDGYINAMVKMAINEGVPVATALQIATINTARHYGLKDIGAIAPGYRADILVFDDMENWRPALVMKDGQTVSTHGMILLQTPAVSSEAVENTMQVKELTVEQLQIPIAGDTANVIGLVPYQIMTKKFKLSIKKVDGCGVSDVENDLLKLAVFERHHATGNIGLGFVKGFGLKTGALASTIAHDSHNLIVIGTNDEDMVLAAKELVRIGGGITVVKNGNVLGSLSLPIAGLMTHEPAEVIAGKQQELIDMAREMGVHKYYSPFLTLSFLSLPVIPALKLTDKGLVDVAAFEHIEVEA